MGTNGCLFSGIALSLTAYLPSCRKRCGYMLHSYAFADMVGMQQSRISLEALRGGRLATLK